MKGEKTKRQTGPKPLVWKPTALAGKTELESGRRLEKRKSKILRERLSWKFFNLSTRY